MEEPLSDFPETLVERGHISHRGGVGGLQLVEDPRLTLEQRVETRTYRSAEPLIIRGVGARQSRGSLVGVLPKRFQCVGF
jgi:hypothetical protein